MKLRIKPNSVRFRISEGELEQLRVGGSVGAETLIPRAEGAPVSFRYEIVRAGEGISSRLVFDGEGFSCRLGDEDLARLFDPDEEGVYVKQVLEGRSGEKLGFVFLVEKDKKRGKKKEKHPKSRAEDGPMMTTNGKEVAV